MGLHTKHDIDPNIYVTNIRKNYEDNKDMNICDTF